MVHVALKKCCTGSCLAAASLQLMRMDTVRSRALCWPAGANGGGGVSGGVRRGKLDGRIQFLYRPWLHVLALLSEWLMPRVFWYYHAGECNQ
jgi:hypothetical protein